MNSPLKTTFFLIFFSFLYINSFSQIINGGFESDPVGTTHPNLSGWSVYGNAGPGDNYIITDYLPHSGTKCLKFTKYSGYIVTGKSNLVIIKPSTDYIYSFWIRSDMENVSANCRMEISNKSGGSMLMGKTYFTPSKEWQEISCRIPATALVIGENVDILMAIRLDRTGDVIYVDDISVAESPGGPNMVINTAAKNLVPEPVNHRLTESAEFSIETDLNNIIHNVNRKVMGVSFHTLTGNSNKAPFSNQPPYPWFFNNDKTNKIKALNLPSTRIYNLKQADVWNNIDLSLDKAAELSSKVNIPQENIILEFDRQDASSYINPSGLDSWQSHVQYSVNKGYKFNHWEIGNEVYLTSTFPSPADYSDHVKACSDAIRSVQPGAKIGMSVHSGLDSNYGWSYYTMEKAAGSYDFVCPHFYSSPVTSNMDNASVEELALETNFRMFEKIQKWNAVLKYFNPGRNVEINDTEWGLTGRGNSGDAETTARNTNIIGSLHRAVRMIYYAREGIVGGANQWLLVTKSADQFGFYLIPVMANSSGTTQVNQVFVPYYLNYYFARYTGDQVLDISGTCPYYENDGYSGPVAPTLITRSSDGKYIYIITANGTQSRNLPCTVSISNFNASSAEGMVLNQADINASPLVNSESDVMSSLPVSITSGKARFTSPAHSVCFIRIKAKEPLTENKVRVSPNPFKRQGQVDIYFENLTSDSMIYIYNISGERIITKTSGSSGTASWNGTNDSGNYVSRGIYLASVVNSSGERETVKVVVE